MQGISWTELTITGQSAHAGTTPMRLRRDPGYVAAAIIDLRARPDAPSMGGAQVATVGRIELQPNLVNVVPSAATMTVDLRNTDDAVLAAGRAAISRPSSTGWRDAEQVTVDDPFAGPLRAGRRSTPR